MATYKVDDKVLIQGKVQEIIENDEGIFYRMKVRHSGGSAIMSVEEQYIKGKVEPDPDPEEGGDEG